MRVVRKFNDFVKNKVNENIETLENPTEVSPEIKGGIEETDGAEDPGNIIDDPEEGYEEEEGGEYEGTLKMKELAEKLGTSITNNEINYEGQKINWFSETESFHIGRKKFNTVDEVLKFLGK